MKSITLKQVAQRAGVSAPAVSFVLNGYWREQGISEPTRDRILRSVEELNYRPSRAAAGLRSKKSNLIGLVIKTMDDPMQSALNHRIFERLAARKFDVVIEVINGGLENLLLHRPEGLIIGPMYLSCDLPSALCKTLGKNYPLVGFEGWGDFAYDMVTYDWAAAIRISVEHLRRLGHRRIGLVVAEKVEQFQSLYHAGSERTVPGKDDGLEWIKWRGTFENGEHFGKEMTLGSDRPTAYVLQSPCFAGGFLRSVIRRGLHVPDDVAFILTGYGEFCDYLPVKATRVSPNLDQLADRIVQVLLDRLNGQLPAQKQYISLAPEIIPGESSGGTLLDSCFGKHGPWVVRGKVH